MTLGLLSQVFFGDYMEVRPKEQNLGILQADKRLRLLAFLQNTLRSAADRINKSNFRGRCGTVNYHTLLHLQ